MKYLSSAIIVVFVMVAFGCSSQSLPRPDHVVIVIEENHGFDQLIDNPDAPYINGLANEGLLFTNSHGVAHPSQPNYIALFSGSVQGVENDRCLEGDTPYLTPNLGHELLENGYTFAGYSETMPENGFTGCGEGESDYSNGSPLYARKHNPWVDWQGNSRTGLPDSTNLTLKEFPDDFSKLPTVAFVMPNEDNDMHNGPDSLTIKRGDKWLKDNLDSYVQWAKSHNSLFILTFDEDNFTEDNRIPTIFVGPMVKNGKYQGHVNHYNVLRTIEQIYNLPNAGPAKEKPIDGIWK
ncbi:MAG TPA: alkaline phosphatase family protein [Balneolaceae bacterium]|nr:alkaline phosphatase family protein [Balneolaceae bacterium]